MYKKKTIIAIIPARRGSKGLPGKNIRLLLGKPLIAWTIEAAKKSQYIDKIIVSTDFTKLSSVAKKFEAEVPFVRPKKLATASAKSADVILHALNRLEMNNDYYDLVILLQPTSPLRTANDIDEAIKMLFSKKASAVVSVCEVEHHPYWSNTLPKNNCMKNFMNPLIKGKNRQQLPTFYRLNGGVYVARIAYFREQKSFFGDKTFAYIMPRERSVDIDTEFDFKFAEFLIKKFNKYLI